MIIWDWGDGEMGENCLLLKHEDLSSKAPKYQCWKDWAGGYLGIVGQPDYPK